MASALQHRYNRLPPKDRQTSNGGRHNVFRVATWKVCCHCGTPRGDIAATVVQFRRIGREIRDECSVCVHCVRSAASAPPPLQPRAPGDTQRNSLSGKARFLCACTAGGYKSLRQQNYKYTVARALQRYMLYGASTVGKMAARVVHDSNSVNFSLPLAHRSGVAEYRIQ